MVPERDQIKEGQTRPTVQARQGCRGPAWVGSVLTFSAVSVLSDCPPVTPAVECSDCLTGREKGLKGKGESLRENLEVLPPELGGSGVGSERGKEVGNGYHVSKVAM